MQNPNVQRFCARCRASLNNSQLFCSNCGAQQPQLVMPVQKKGLPVWSITTLALVGSIIGACALCAVFGAIIKRNEKQEVVTVSPTPTSIPTPSVSTSPTPEPIGSVEERLQVAADIRNYLKDQDIPAKVVAAGTKLVVLYTYAKAEYEPQDAFFRQQGKQGLRKIANAGFETLQIESYDKNSQLQRRTFSLIEYRNHK